MSEACQKQEETISALTPLEIPPIPHTLIETPTSQALSTNRKNPQILPETLTQEITPAVPHSQIETQFPTETALEEEETTEVERADTIEEEEDESKAGGDEEEIELTGEGVEGNEGEGVESQVVEGDAGTMEGEEIEERIEGRLGKVDKDITDDDKEIGDKEAEERLKDGVGEVDEEDGDERIVEKAEEKDGDENESASIVEEEVQKQEEEEEEEAEIVLLDDVTTDDQGTTTDERSTRSIPVGTGSGRMRHWQVGPRYGENRGRYPSCPGNNDPGGRYFSGGFGEEV